MKELNVKELKVMAKGLGVVGYSKMDKAALISAVKSVLLNQLKSLLVKAMDQVSAPVEEEVLGTIEAPVVVIEKQEKKEVVEMNVLNVGTYVQHIKNGRFFKVAEYLTRGNKQVAKLIFKVKATDTKIQFNEIPVSMLMNQGFYRVATVDEVKAAYTKPVEKPVQRTATTNHTDLSHKYEVNVHNQQFFMTNKETKQSVKVATGNTVKTLLNNYETTIRGLKVKITQTQTKETKPAVSTKVFVCTCCRKPVHQNVVDFLGRNQAKIPADYKGKVLCYSCQDKTGVRAALKNNRTPNGVGVMASHVVDDQTVQPNF